MALSFSDGSFWCYTCNDYITNRDLDYLRKEFAKVKFQGEEINNLAEDLKNININKEAEEKFTFTRENLISGLKAKKYRNIAVMTGAGISVSCGIPDFRTPGTGLYSQLEKYNLPFPEAIFQLTFFKKNPEPFYTLAKEFLVGAPKPGIAHHFIKILNEKEMLLQNYT